jgi:hypothetical protein
MIAMLITTKTATMTIEAMLKNERLMTKTIKARITIIIKITTKIDWSWISNHSIRGHTKHGIG